MRTLKSYLPVRFSHARFSHAPKTWQPSAMRRVHTRNCDPTLWTPIYVKYVRRRTCFVCNIRYWWLSILALKARKLEARYNVFLDARKERVTARGSTTRNVFKGCESLSSLRACEYIWSGVLRTETHLTYIRILVLVCWPRLCKLPKFYSRRPR